MNRSILIVICDFLMVSLLAFSTVDVNRVADPNADRQIKVEMPTNQVESGKDLAAVMRLALDEERKRRDLLMGELSRARESMGQQQSIVAEREKQVATYQQEVQLREQQAARLQQEQSNLQQQFAAAQTNLLTLNQQLHSTSIDAVVSKEKAAALEAEARRQAAQSEALQKQLAELQRSNQVVMAERQQLATQLQVAETEKRFASEQVVRMQDEVKVEREEKARLSQQAVKLAEGVKALASKSGELAQEIRENRPMAANAIFNDFSTNRVAAMITAYRAGGLGLDNTKRRDFDAVLVSDGTNTVAMCHVQDTPFVFWSGAPDWDGMGGNLTRGSASIQIRALSFQRQDPRVVLIPVTPQEAQNLGGKVYRCSAEPYKFQDAVLVGAREGYYGECKFQIDLATPDYVRLDNSFLKGLFGKFNPSRGDLVFSKTGELLGIMVNSTYCYMLRDFQSAATFHFGSDLRAEHTSEALSRFAGYISQLPAKLQ